MGQIPSKVDLMSSKQIQTIGCKCDNTNKEHCHHFANAAYYILTDAYIFAIIFLWDNMFRWASIAHLKA